MNGGAELDEGEERNAVMRRRPLAANARLPARRGHPWFAVAWPAVLALPGLLAAQSICDLVVEARGRVKTLEQDYAEAASMLQVETERLVTIDSNMEDSEEREAFQKAESAYRVVRAEQKTLYQTYDELQYSKSQFREELQKYKGELAAMKLTRRDLTKVESWPEVKQFRERAAELESKIRVLIGGASFDDLPGLIKKMSYTGHLDWLRGGNLEQYAASNFLTYEVPSFIAKAGGQLGHAQANLAVRVHWYGDPKIRAESVSLQAEIRSYANQVFELQTGAAAQLAELDRTLRSLAEAMRRAGVSDHSSQPSGFRHGALSEEAYQKRQGELEDLMQPLEAKIEQHRLQHQSILRRLSEIDKIEVNYRKAKRALQRAGAEVPEFERKRREEARQQRNDAEIRLTNIGVSRRMAWLEVKQLEDPLVPKVAAIHRAIEDGRSIPGRAKANADASRHEQCRVLVVGARGSLGAAESGYQEIVACLGGSHGQLIAEIRRLREQLDEVVCEPGTGPPRTPTGENLAPGFVQPDTRQSSAPGCPSVELEEGFVRVPPVRNKFYQGAIGEIEARGLNAFAYEFRLAQRPADDGLVTEQDPAACAVVARGTTIRIGYNTAHDYVPETDPGASGVTGAAEDTSQDPTGDDTGLFGQSSAEPQGFTAGGGVKTISSSTTPPGGTAPTAGGTAPSPGGGAGAAAGVPSALPPTGDSWATNAQAAKSACDLGRALRNADILAAENPRHPWLAQNYQTLLDDIAKQNAAETAMRQARVVLGKPDPTRADVQQAAALARQAQSHVTICISQRVSSLTGPIKAAEAAVKQADAGRRRAAAASLLGTLTGALSVASAGSGGRATAVAGAGGVPSLGSGGVDIRDVMVAGGLVPPGGGGTTTTGGSSSGTGSATGGSSSRGGSSGGGGSRAIPCNFCVISVFGAARERVHYVYSLRRSLPHPSCSGGRAVAVGYYIFSDSPTDDDDRPLSYFPREEQQNVLRSLGTLGTVSKTCGPCGSHSQAKSVVRRRCPNPLRASSFGL